MQWLDRFDLKILMGVPSLGVIASELYFREIRIHFEAHSSSKTAINIKLGEKVDRSSQTRYEIINRILTDHAFARRVRILRLSENVTCDTSLPFEIRE